MSRWLHGRAPSATRGLSYGDIARAGLILIGLVAAAGYLATTEEKNTLVGTAAVTDGDSLRVGGEVVRLDGIDAPELRQSCSLAGKPYSCGDLAKQELARQISGASLTCQVLGRDRYRRRLARCEVDGRDLGAMLVRRGFAVSYRGRYATEEEQAKSDKVGLWAGQFEAPAEWRRDHPQGVP